MSQTRPDASPAKPAEPHLPDTAEEAHDLAVEGMEEIEHGNKEEGRFLIDEARNLDRAAADEVTGSGKT